MVLGSVNGINGATSDTQVVIGSGAASNSIYRLDVQRGYINTSSGYCIAGSCVSDWGALAGTGGSSQWINNGNDIYYSLGNVGIKTSTPLATLDVNGSVAA